MRLWQRSNREDPGGRRLSKFSLYPMVNAFITSLKTGTGLQLSFCGLSNYIRAFQDDVFVQSIINCIFLPCATSLVAYAIVFRSLFATDGFINSIMMNLGIIKETYNFLANPASTKNVKKFGLYFALTFVSVISVFPFFWMVVAATNNSVDVIGGKLTFGLK